MSAYPVPPAAPGAPSPHTGFVPPGAQAPPGTNASVYSANSAPFSSPYGAPTRQTGYSHPEQYGSGSTVPQQYQQLSSYATADVHPPANSVGTSTASQQQKQPATGSFQSAMHSNSSSVQTTLQGSSALTQQQQHQQTPAAEEEAMACTQEIAHAFVYQYYHMLHENPGDIYRFYDQDSKMHRGSDRAYSDGESGCQPEDYCVRAVGLQRIMHAFQRLDFDRATCRILNIDAQEVQNGGILVLVTGCLKHSKDKPEREFVQTVLLAKMRPPRAGWYVHTEMFSYLDAMMSAAGERAAAQARKEQQEELRQQQRQLERQKQQQHQQLEQQRKQLEQQKQKQLEQQDQHQGSNAAHDEQRPRQREGTTHGASHPKKEGRYSSPAPRKDPIDEKTSYPGDNHEAVVEHGSQQPAAEEKQQEGETGGEQAARPAKTAERVRSKWTKQEAPQESEETSPHWPKPGQVPEKPVEKDQCIRGARQQHNYDPQSFAFKVLQNVRPVAQKGFAIPANPSDGSEGENGPRHETRDREEGKCQGKGSHGDMQQQQGSNKRLIILTELPPPISVDEVKRAVAENLSSFNQGQCIDIRKPPSGRTFGVIIELDTCQSAQYLMEYGLSLNGRQVRIDFVRPRGAGNAGRGGRGGHIHKGSWEDRRPSGENRRGGRSGGAPGPEGQEKAPAEEGDEEGGQWIDPAARRRARPPRGGGAFMANGPARTRGGASGFRGGHRSPQE